MPWAYIAVTLGVDCAQHAFCCPGPSARRAQSAQKRSKINALQRIYDVCNPVATAGPRTPEQLPAQLGSTRTSVNLMLGTQAIYGPSWRMYNFSAADVLTEQVRMIVRMGGNQLKLRLSPSACKGYHLASCAGVSNLTALARVPAFAQAFAEPQLTWYMIWLYSYKNPHWHQLRDWQAWELKKEYEETYAWALHMLRTHANTGKVFMVGNWEGDWDLMKASGCRVNGKFDKSCAPSAVVIQRMVQWGQVRQRAIDEATRSAGAVNVTMLYYMEFNQCAQTLAGKPSVANSVISHVNPDLVSFSSYSCTDKYHTTKNVTATTARFHRLLDHVQVRHESLLCCPLLVCVRGVSTEMHGVISVSSTLSLSGAIDAQTAQRTPVQARLRKEGVHWRVWRQGEPDRDPEVHRAVLPASR